MAGDGRATGKAADGEGLGLGRRGRAALPKIGRTGSLSQQSGVEQRITQYVCMYVGKGEGSQVKSSQVKQGSGSLRLLRLLSMAKSRCISRIDIDIDLTAG